MRPSLDGLLRVSCGARVWCSQSIGSSQSCVPRPPYHTRLIHAQERYPGARVSLRPVTRGAVPRQRVVHDRLSNTHRFRRQVRPRRRSLAGGRRSVQHRIRQDAWCDRATESGPSHTGRRPCARETVHPTGYTFTRRAATQFFPTVGISARATPSAGRRRVRASRDAGAPKPGGARARGRVRGRHADPQLGTAVCAGAPDRDGRRSGAGGSKSDPNPCDRDDGRRKNQPGARRKFMGFIDDAPPHKVFLRLSPLERARRKRSSRRSSSSRFLFNFALLLPGTGNEAVHFQVDFEVHHPILVCTYTNVAVDNLVEGFVVAGVTPLRVGFGAKVKASLGEYTLDYRLEQHPLKPKVDKLVEEKKSLEKRRAQLEKKVAGVQKDGKAGALARLERMRTALVLAEKQAMSIKSKLYAMHQEMLRDIASAVDVVSCSLVARLVARNVTDLHDLHYLGECGPERTRLPGGVSGRGIDVNRACVADTVDERGKSVSYLSVLV